MDQVARIAFMRRLTWLKSPILNPQRLVQITQIYYLTTVSYVNGSFIFGKPQWVG
jgi:hypothetical protein